MIPDTQQIDALFRDVSSRVEGVLGLVRFVSWKDLVRVSTSCNDCIIYVSNQCRVLHQHDKNALTEILPGSPSATDDKSLSTCFLLLQPEDERVRKIAYIYEIESARSRVLCEYSIQACLQERTGDVPKVRRLPRPRAVRLTLHDTLVPVCRRAPKHFHARNVVNHRPKHKRRAEYGEVPPQRLSLLAQLFLRTLVEVPCRALRKHFTRTVLMHGLCVPPFLFAAHHAELVPRALVEHYCPVRLCLEGERNGRRQYKDAPDARTVQERAGEDGARALDGRVDDLGGVAFGRPHRRGSVCDGVDVGGVRVERTVLSIVNGRSMRARTWSMGARGGAYTPLQYPQQ